MTASFHLPHLSYALYQFQDFLISQDFQFLKLAVFEGPIAPDDKIISLLALTFLIHYLANTLLLLQFCFQN